MSDSREKPDPTAERQSSGRQAAPASDDWKPSSWRSKPVAQEVVYPDPKALDDVLLRLTRLPPLVTSWEVETLKKQFADQGVRNADLFFFHVLKGFAGTSRRPDGLTERFRKGLVEDHPTDVVKEPSHKRLIGLPVTNLVRQSLTPQGTSERVLPERLSGEQGVFLGLGEGVDR